MNINIKATNMELTPAIKEYVEKRVAGIEKFLTNADAFVHVEVGKTTNHHKQGNIFKAELAIRMTGVNAFALAESSDLYAAIDEAREQLVQELTHMKDRKQTLFKRGAISVKKLLKGIASYKR
jgi:putative sigma-54 modulation protein